MKIYVFLTFSALSALSLAICSLTLCLKKHWNVRGKALRQNVLVLINSELCGYEKTLRFGWGTRWVALGYPSLDPTPVDSHPLIPPFLLKRQPSRLANTFKTFVVFFSFLQLTLPTFPPFSLVSSHPLFFWLLVYLSWAKWSRNTVKKVGTMMGPSFKIIVIKKITYFAFILVNSFPVTRRAFSFAKASCGLLDKKIVT